MNAKSSDEGNGGLARFRIGTSRDPHHASVLRGTIRDGPRASSRLQAKGNSIMLAPFVIGSTVSIVVLVTGAITAFAFQTRDPRKDRL
jgi:hypothetical protein